jgi:ATP-dependent HslUV protease ATP-binding subunit HslU
MFNKENEWAAGQDKFLTPSEIVTELDRFIIGQHEAKRHVAIALRNRWRRMQVPAAFRSEIVPNNILMIGATGVGKTEIARRLAKITDAPFAKVEASKFTEVGYVGRDVESMVRDLLKHAISLVTAKRKDAVKDKAIERVEEAILDALIPPVKSGTSMTAHDEELVLNTRTRERFRDKIRKGELDDRKIEITIQDGSNGNSMITPAGMDENTLMDLQEMIGKLSPRKSRKRKLTIADARKLLLEEETTRLIDMDDVKEEAILLAENSGIIFIDEIDKIANAGGGQGKADVSREGVQRDLLPIVEGSAVSTRHGVVNTDHILFIAAGAFHYSKPSDLIPKLQGRFPIRVELENLTEDNFYQILKDPHNALTKQYEQLLLAEGIHLSFTDSSLRELARVAFHLNATLENIGARRLHTVMSQLLNDILFDVPDRLLPGSTVEITDLIVQKRLNQMAENRDLSQFIL